MMFDANLVSAMLLSINTARVDSKGSWTWALLSTNSKATIVCLLYILHMLLRLIVCGPATKLATSAAVQVPLCELSNRVMKSCAGTMSINFTATITRMRLRNATGGGTDERVWVWTNKRMLLAIQSLLHTSAR